MRATAGTIGGTNRGYRPAAGGLSAIRLSLSLKSTPAHFRCSNALILASKRRAGRLSERTSSTPTATTHRYDQPLSQVVGMGQIVSETMGSIRFDSVTWVSHHSCSVAQAQTKAKTAFRIRMTDPSLQHV